jgi:iron complex transport system substrate-binding protein
MDTKKTLMLVAVAVLIIAVIAGGYYVSRLPVIAPSAAQNHTVTDLSGRTTVLPVTVNRVACLVGPSYEKVFLLGERNKIAIVPPFVKQMPWAVRVIPNLSTIPDMASYQDPNLEELMARKVDVVFFWDYPKPLEKMVSSGIPVVVTQQSLSAEQRPSSIAQFRKTIKDEVTIFGNVLGPDARRRADDYNAYFDTKVDRILAVTSKIPASERPDIYYVRGPKALTTHGQYTYTDWWVQIAGGNLVSRNISQQVPEVSMEQVIAWDPDIIIMGRVNNTALILDDPKWKDIKAVKTGKVYVNPDGVMYWDYSSEGVLLMEYLAKTFHPDKFPDLDMRKEVKEYYSKFYTYNLTDDEADRILNHLAPQ